MGPKKISLFYTHKRLQSTYIPW